MDSAALHTEVMTDPAGMGYAPYLPDSPGRVVEMLNEPRFSMPKTTMVTARGIMASFGLGPIAGAAFLDKLEALGTVNSTIKWAMVFLRGEQGIDVGEPATYAVLSSLVGVGGITQEEVDGVKAMALQPASRAEVLFGVGVQITEADVRAVLES